MNRSARILAYSTASSPDDPALRRAADVARATHASLTVADVLPPSDGPVAPILRRRRRLEELGRAVRLLRRDGLDVAVRVAVGDPATELIRMVVAGRHRMLVKTASVRDVSGHRFFGTTAATLLRDCPCPVWVAREEDRRRVRRVLAAVEVDDAASDRGALSREVIAAALRIARPSGAALHLCNTFDPVGESLLASTARGGGPSVADAYVTSLRRSHLSRLRALAAVTGAGDAELHVQRGVPEEHLPALAEHLDVDLVVVGTVGRRGIAGLVVGNTVEKVLRRVPRAVLAIKPRGFVSARAAKLVARAS